jgi:predicted MFS family arabinose efflux permease
VGKVFSQIFGGQIVDKISRKRTIRLLAVISVIGVTLQTAAQNLPMLMLGRFIAGVAIGKCVSEKGFY